MNLNIGFIIDLDGTMYHGKQIVPRADQFISQLEELSIPHLFLTNNSSRTPEQVAEHLMGMGIAARAEQVYTTAQASARYIQRIKEDAKVYLIGESGLETAIRQAGLEIVQEQPDFVVQGIDRQFDYAKLAQAVDFIRSGAGFIQTNPDLLLPSDGGFLPGAGSIGAAIQASSGAQPVIIGKPSTIIMNDAIELLDLPAERIWMVGDNPATDIKAGVAAGCRTALVLSGLATRDNLSTLLTRADVTPDLVVDHLLDLLDQVLKVNE